MNKQCYRIIFSRTLGELRVVGELARSCGSSDSGMPGVTAARLWITLRPALWLIGLALFAQPVFANGTGANGIIADGNLAAAQRPEVINTQNGLPQVNINAPNQAGVSHNQYQQFDVSQQRAILNNSAVMTNTQLAGYIQGNAKLNPNAAPARVILNEVNSNNPSQLRGFLEVAGGKAQVVVANPSGILCDGCGTINAGRMTLTTGKPQLNADGSLAGYRVERGLIRIEGGGLNGDARQDTEYAEVLGRAVKVNAGIWAREGIDLVAGRNQISADGKVITPLSGSDANAPEMAIDMGQMGGMYSGQIRMIGTEAGVGVRNQGGHLQAAKTLTVNSEGKLSWQTGSAEPNTQAGGDITLTARDTLQHQGKLHSGGNLSLQSRQGGISQSGTLAASGNVTLQAAQTISSSGSLLAGSDINSNLVRPANLILTSQEEVRASGNLLSQQQIQINAKRVDLSQGRLAAQHSQLIANGGDVVLQQTQMDTQSLSISSQGSLYSQQAQIRAGNWQVNTTDLFNQGGVWSQVAAGESRFALTGTLDNTDGSIEARQLSLNSAALNNLRGRLIALDSTAQRWQVSGRLNNQAGILGSNGKLHLESGLLDNQQGLLQSQSDLTLNTQGNVDNSSGKILSGGSLQLSSATLGNQAGRLQSRSDLTLSTQGNVDNNSGEILSDGSLQLNSAQLSNQSGVLQSQSDLRLTTQGNTDNRSGKVLSAGSLQLSSALLGNQNGLLQSQLDLRLTTQGNTDNRSGKILSGGSLQLDSALLGNQSGVLQSQADLRLTTQGNVDNRSGKILSGGSLQLDSALLGNQNGLLQSQVDLRLTTQGNVDNRSGKILSGGNLSLQSQKELNNLSGEISAQSLQLTSLALNNSSGLLISRGRLQLDARQSVNNQQGVIEAGEEFTASTAGLWDNRNASTVGAKQLQLAAGSLDNSAGNLQSGGTLTLNTLSNVNNLKGRLTARQDLAWQGGALSLFNNDGGKLLSGGALLLQGGELSNRQQGVIQSQQALSLRLAGAWDNQGGKLASGGSSTLRALNLNNTQGQIQALDSLDMQFTQALDNRNGHIISQRAQRLQSESILNNQGWIGSLGTLTTHSQYFDNQQGEVASQQEAELTSTRWNNQYGSLQSAASLLLRSAQDFSNQNGKISAQSRLWLLGLGLTNSTPAGKVYNAAGQWLAGEQLWIQAKGIDNQQQGLLYSQKQLQLALNDGLDNRQGKIQSGTDLHINATALLNSNGIIDSQQQLNLQLSGLLNNIQGTLRANQAQQILAQQLQNAQGVISSLGSLQLRTQQFDNATGRVISQGNGDYHFDYLANQQGKIHSGGSLTLNGNSVDNQAGQLVASQALVLNSGKIDNRNQGMISSQGSLNVQAQQLNNRDGGLLISTGQAAINTRYLDNTAGRLQSAGSLILSQLTTLDNRQGALLANQALAINQGETPSLALFNQNGNIQSGGTLAVTSQSLDNQGGKLLSQSALSLSVQQDYTHRIGDTIGSNQSVSFSVAGVFTNLAEWLLPGDLTLNSTQLNNLATLVGKTLKLTTGSLLNQGRIEADSLTINSDTLDNQSTLMGDQISVNSRIIDNHGKQALIAATEQLSLTGRERLTHRDQAFIYSAGSLQLSSEGVIENLASSIEAEGDVTLRALRFDNLREGLSIEREAEKSDYKWHRYNYYWRSYGSGVMTDPTPFAPTTQRLTFQNEEAVQNNPYGTLLTIDAANKKAEVKVKDNKGKLMSLWVSYEALVPNADGSYNLTFYGMQGPVQREVPTPYHNTVWREFSSKPSIEQWDPEKHISSYDQPFISDYSNFRERSVSGSRTSDKLVSAGTGASLLAGGNMVLHIGEQLLNDASTLSANGNLTIDGSANIINRGYSVNQRIQEFIQDHYDRDTKHWYPTFNRDETIALTTIDGVISGNGNVTLKGARLENTTVNQAQISQAEAAQKAAAAERAEWERNPLLVTLQDAGWQPPETGLPGSKPSLTPSLPPPPALPTLTPAEVALTEQQHLPNVAKNIPDNGLFRQQTAANSPFLVVTDARFTSRSNFLSSDYLLQQVGYDPSQVHKRLGDGYYEQRTVREQLLMLTGRPSLKGDDAMAQYQSLMNNGIKAATQFQLVPGVALSPAQIAALQQDIVWLVSESVDTANGPQTVWVPKVYLANSTLRLTGDGALIAGGNLQLSTDSVNNAGNLFADKAMSIDSSQFLHQGGDIRADTLNIQADSISLSTNLQDALRQASISARELDLSGSDISLRGAKISASENLSLNASNNLTIGTARSSTSADLQFISGAMGNRNTGYLEMPGERMASVSGEWQQALGSSISAGGNLSLKAGQDITLQGSQAKAGGKLGVQAGGNVSLLADTTTNNTRLEANSATTSVSNRRQADSVQTSALSGDNGVLIRAGGDFTAEGAQVDSKAGGIGLSAQQVTIKEARQQLTESDSEQHKGGKSQRQIESSSNTSIGGVFSAQQGVTVIAKQGDIAVQGSTLQSEKGTLGLKAAGDISLKASLDEQQYKEQGSSKSKGFLSSKQSAYQKEEYSSTANGSLLSGQQVILQSGKDINVMGSNIVASDDIALTAGNNITVGTTENRYQSSSASQSKKSGLSGTGGIGISYGSESLKVADTEKRVTNTGSTVGSTQGNVTMKAGNTLTVQGSDILANKDISLSGKEVNILAAENQSSQTHSVEQKKSGLTLALSGTVGSAVNSAVTSANEASKESDGRLAALQGMKAALSGVQATQAGALAAENPADPNAIGISLSYGSQSSKSEQRASQTQSQGSMLTAGKNLTIRATDSDINVQGSQLQAGKDISLNAARDVNLLSAENTQQLEGKNSSKGGSIGIGIGVGQGSAGISISASVNKGKGSESGNGVSHTETTLNAGNNINITSGRDTTLTGAQVNGDKVSMDVGRNLTLTSEQDSDNYDSKQQNASAGGSFTFGSMSGSGSVNLSREKIKSNYDSVQEQTGIFAGKGGFDVKVGEHTQLNGAVIGSTATADKNKLDTGTLGYGDIKNQADYKVESQSVGISSGGGAIGGDFKGNMSGGLLAGTNSSGSASSTTQSAVSEGNIILRDQANQKQDVNNLSRDVENANQTLNPIFDKEKEQKRIREAQLLGEIGSQVADITRTQGDINGLKAAKEKLGPLKENATKEERNTYMAMLRNSDVYKAEMQKFGTGSALQQGIQAATAAIQGLAGGNMAQALSGAAAPYLAEVIHKMTTDAKGNVNKEANLMAHSVLGAVTSAINGNSALAGAAGAATAELMAPAIIASMGWDKNNLTEEQKQTVVALSSLAAGLAGGLAGDSTGDALAGAQTGKNAVENNFLSTTSSTKRDELAEKVLKGDKSLETAKKYLELENADQCSDALVAKFNKDPTAMSPGERTELTSYLMVYAAEMKTQYGDAVTKELITGMLTGQDYLKSAPQTEAQQKAQTIMKTWGYHKSNASIGDPVVLYGLGPLGNSIKAGMLGNAAIGVGVNAAVQLGGKDPFNYVDTILAGVTAAVTTGKGVGVSAGINMGGAALGSAVNGDNPIGAVIGAGAGSLIGSGTTKLVTEGMSTTAKEGTKELVGAVSGSAASEVVGGVVKDGINAAEKKDDKK